MSRNMPLIQYDWCPYKKRRNKETDTQGGHLMMQTVTRVMHLHAKKSQALLANNRI